MSKADVLRLQEYLRHISQAIERIERYTDDIDEVDFLLDEKTQDAVSCSFWDSGSWNSRSNVDL